MSALPHVPFVQPDPEGWLKKFHFSVPIKPRFSETDMSGHVNNISYWAAGRGAMVHIDRASGRSRTLPEIVQEKIRELEGIAEQPA